ncbi:MAG: DNA starvation/stationary phase protection protein [Akkermansia sp.]
MKTELTSQLNDYLANLGVMYIKIHNLHWNIVGVNFKSTHEYLEVLYKGFGDALDDIAECIKMHHGFPLASLKDYLAHATVTELESQQYCVSDALVIVLADIKSLKLQAEEARRAADADDLYDVVALLEDQLENYCKTLWFLEAMACCQSTVDCNPQ